jgi:hypothetical protein
MLVSCYFRTPFCPRFALSEFENPNRQVKDFEGRKNQILVNKLSRG